MDVSKLQEVMVALQEAEQSIVPDDLRAQGWVYRDMPGRATPEAWTKLLSVMGEGNYKVLIASRGEDWVRGQFLLSPKAIDNMRNHAAIAQR